MNVIEALNWRYAVRKFSQQRLDDEKVQELLSATRLSATSYGLQPFRLIEVNDLELRKELLRYAMGQDKVVDCSHLIVIAVQTDIGDELVDSYIKSVEKKRGIAGDDLQGLADHIKNIFANMNAEQKREWAYQQAYIALGTMLTAAATMKIDACPMTGFEAEGFNQVLSLAELGLESVVICALGERHPDDSNARLAKVRYDHSEMVIAM